MSFPNKAIVLPYYLLQTDRSIAPSHPPTNNKYTFTLHLVTKFYRCPNGKLLQTANLIWLKWCNFSLMENKTMWEREKCWFPVLCPFLQRFQKASILYMFRTSPNDKIKHWAKLRAFTDKTLTLYQMTNF